MRRIDPAWLVIAAGTCAALHVGKLPPAVPALREALGVTLVQAGFLLSAMQIAGMTAGVLVGLACDGLGLRRSLILGLLTLAAASLAGAWADGAAALLVLRAIEGLGFLLVCLPAPALVRRLVATERLSVMLGIWGAYMPFATALALLTGPLVLQAAGWRIWWGGLGLLTLLMAGAALYAVPGDATKRRHGAPVSLWVDGWRRLARTLGASGPWLVATCFGVYAGQWLAVIGFLPSIYQQAGVAGALTGALTAAVAAVNMGGNIASGRLLQAGAAPHRLLALGFSVMGVAAFLAFARVGGHSMPPAVQYLAVLTFSLIGGVIPGTLFSLAVRVAPDESTVSTTVGWMQQSSALGQFLLPPLVAWMAERSGGWHLTWVATGGCALAGLAVSAALARRPCPRGAT